MSFDGWERVDEVEKKECGEERGTTKMMNESSRDMVYCRWGWTEVGISVIR